MSHDARLFLRLGSVLWPHRARLFAGLGATLVVAGLQLTRPLLLGRVVASAFGAEPHGPAVWGIALGAALVGTQIAGLVQKRAVQVAGARAIADLRRAIFERMQRLELRYLDRTPDARLVHAATTDAEALAELFNSDVIDSVADAIALAGIVTSMLLLDARMSLFAFAIVPPVALLVGFVRRRARAAHREVRGKTARLGAFLAEQVAGMSVVQAFSLEAEREQEFDGINRHGRDAAKRVLFYEAFLYAAVEMSGIVCVASLLWWASSGHGGPARFALLVTFTGYIKQFLEPIDLFAQRTTIVQGALSGAERIFAVLDEGALERDEARDGDPMDPATNGAIDGEAIAFEKVSFAYDSDVPVLRDVSLAVRAGERVAFVGATGAGKTTLTALLLRLYPLQHGAVRVGGRDIRAYAPRALRRLFAVVPQDVFFFPGTVASNVALTELPPDPDKVEQALERVNAMEFLRSRGGVDARVDERGGNFSAGERQLLALARALYLDAPYLVLDEATANVDSDTEARIQDAIDTVLRGRTAIVIAHRLATIRRLDRIFVFHEGRLVEDGGHEELMRRGGFYARLHRYQSAVERIAQNAISATGGA